MTVTQNSPEVTVVFLLYNAERTVGQLLDLVLKQKQPNYPNQTTWLKVLFHDDCSKDQTVEILRRQLDATENHSHIKVHVNAKNLGLSASINNVMKNLVDTPFVLTCHLDCFFTDPLYVFKMLNHISAHPKAATITGLQNINFDRKVTFSERVNLIANLMDIVPPKATDSTNPLIPIGFTEGRCDIFRVEALKIVGYHDTTLRTAGEDQILCGKLRGAGFEIYQALDCRFDLSVSPEQDSILKLFKHQRLFGRVHPYILFAEKNSRRGLVGKSAGDNRKIRSLLRLQQVLSCASYFLAPLSPLTLLFPIFSKWLLFKRHFSLVPMNTKEWGIFVLTQPLFDLSYTLGLIEGLAFLITRRLGKVEKI